MKSDNAIRNSTSIFVGIIVAIAAFVRGAAACRFCLSPAPSGAVCAAAPAGQPHGSPQEESKGSPAAPSLWCRTSRMNLSATFCCSCEPTRHRCTSNSRQQHHMGMGHRRSACHRQRRRTRLIRVHGLDGFESAGSRAGQAGASAVRVDQHCTAAPEPPQQPSPKSRASPPRLPHCPTRAFGTRPRVAQRWKTCG